MIEPYASVIREYERQFRSIGLTVSQDSEYQLTFSNGDVLLELGTEKYYHPSLSACLVSRNGEKYEIGVLQEALDQDAYIRYRDALRHVMEKYGLRSADSNSDQFQSGVLAYLRLSVQEVVRFLSTFREVIFGDSNVYKDAYAKTSKSRKVALGLNL